MAERVSLSYKVVSGHVSKQMARTIAEIENKACGYHTTAVTKALIEGIEIFSINGGKFLLGIHKGKPIALTEYIEDKDRKLLTTSQTSISSAKEKVSQQK